MHEPKMRKARVKKQRDVRIHAELWHTANCLLDAGKRERAGSTHQFRASLVFRAFSLEAFLNWLGPRLIPHWRYLERLNPRQKLDLLADLIHVTPDYGSHPWKIVKDLFGFRNDIAHGKPETISTETFEDLDEFLDGKLGELIRNRLGAILHRRKCRQSTGRCRKDSNYSLRECECKTRGANWTIFCRLPDPWGGHLTLDLSGWR
jgi:hypothetical protein